MNQLTLEEKSVGNTRWTLLY